MAQDAQPLADSPGDVIHLRADTPDAFPRTAATLLHTGAHGRTSTLLVVDEDEATFERAQQLAEEQGFSVVREHSIASARASLAAIHPDGALVDVRNDEAGGFELLRAIKALDPQSQVILTTGAASVESAVEAIKAGALDYVSKPFDLDRLRELFITVKKSLERRETLLRLDADVARQFEFYGLIGRSPSMQELFDAVRRFAPYARTVLVTGETGTGKELVAKALHRLGPRRDKKLVTVNCSAVVETLFESEVFGHVRGAFTGATDNKVGLFEHAHHGTIFLDEIGELPLALQAKMLRAVEVGEVQRVGSLETRRTDVFAVAATNRDLRAESAAGRFRSDLFFRLATIELRISPLRDRRDDIPYLTAAFIRECATRMNRPIRGITSSAERLLQTAPWPGNVRELRNVIERACILTDSRIVSEREIAASMSPHQSGSDGGARPGAFGAFGGGGAFASIGAFGSVGHEALGHGVSGQGAVDSGPSDTLMSTAQRDQIRRVMAQVGGNKAAAAKHLGISRRSLYRWLDRLDLPQ